jgi:hypothetical protein
MQALRDNQLAANASIEHLMDFSTALSQQVRESNEMMDQQMSAQTEGLRAHMDARMMTFAQHVEVPVHQAVHTSTTASNIANELSSQYAGIQENLTRAFHASIQAHQASEATRAEAHQQAELTRHNLKLATAAMTRVQHENASARTQTKTLAAHMAHLSIDDDHPVPTYPTTSSEFTTWFNPILNTPLHPQSVRFESQASSATTTRQSLPE